MAFTWNRFAYTNFHELNLDWFNEHFKEIFEEWEELYNTLTQWKDDTDADLAQWKEDTLAEMDTWERELLAALDEWKVDTGNDISDWESGVISDLNAWKETFLAAYESLEDRVEAIVSDTEDMVDNLAEPFSTSKDYKIGDYVIQNGSLYVFTSNHSAGAWDDSDASEASTMMSYTDTRNFLNFIFKFNKNLYNPDDPNVLSNTYMDINGNISSYSNRKVTGFLPVVAGKKLVISRVVSGTQEAFTWAAVCFFDAQKNVVSGGTYNASGTTIPDGVAFARCTFSATYPDIQIELCDDTNYTTYTPFTVSISEKVYVEDDQDKTLAKRLEMQEDIEDNLSAVVVEPKKSVTDNSPGFTTGAVGANGTVYSYNDFEYSAKIPVQTGDVVEAVSYENPKPMRFLCAYAGNTVVPAAGITNDATSYVVTNNTITGVVVSVRKTSHVTAIRVTHTIDGEYITKYYPINQKLGNFNWKGDISNGSRVYLPLSNVRFNVVWTFTGHVTTMGEFEIGIDDGTFRTLAKIDSTKLYYRSDTSGTIANKNHGLTIAGDIRVEIISDFRVGKVKSITVLSGANSFTENTDAFGVDASGRPAFKSNGAVFSDCAFSWAPMDIDKPIWIFGDSWVSMYPERWIYYAVENDFTNSWMLNSYSGETAENGLKALKSLLEYRKPDYIVWTYGMNDTDTAVAVNTAWKAAFDEFIQICNEYKIIPILYTVPTTPTIINTHKNAIITASGYRYIDAVAAMGADESGNWFTGYQSSDGNHTTIAGAKALYNRVLCDFPEIMYNK